MGMIYEYKIDKMVCPHLHKFHSLNGLYSDEGEEYYEVNSYEIHMEEVLHRRFVFIRRNLGDKQKIHDYLSV